MDLLERVFFEPVVLGRISRRNLLPGLSLARHLVDQIRRVLNWNADLVECVSITQRHSCWSYFYCVEIYSNAEKWIEKTGRSFSYPKGTAISSVLAYLLPIEPDDLSTLCAKEKF